MPKFRLKIFSGTRIINTSGMTGFTRGRKYDTDLDRLGRMETSQSELRRTDDIRKEAREMHSILRRGLLGNLKNDDI
jgi:hypothetical protein